MSKPISMSRRAMLRGLAAAGAPLPLRARAAANTGGDVILITADQQSARTVGALGLASGQTPNIDGFAEGGTLFANAWCADPTCCPARTAWALGRPGSETGVVLNPLPADPGLPELGQHLRAHGVETVLFGKWHVPGRAARLGYDVRSPSPMHSDIGDLLQLRLARELLHERPPGEPLFLWISLLGPHDLCQATALEAGAAERLPLGWSTDALPPPPPNLFARGGEAPTFRSARRRGPWERWGPERWRQLRAWNDRLVGALDTLVGGILEAIAGSPYAERATVVFTSDHGDNLGEHGLAFKESLYEAALGVPFAVKGPGARRPRGIDRRSLVSGLDLFPTICGLFDVAPPPGLPGRSLVPLLNGDEADAHEAIFAECLVEGRAVRDARHKLVHFRGEERGQLFDLAADPYERDDRYEDSSLDAVREGLHARLAEREARLHLHPAAKLSWAAAHDEVLALARRPTQAKTGSR